MLASLRLGGLGWRLELAGTSILNEAKFAAYLEQIDGPTMTVVIDSSLAGERSQNPRVTEQDGKLLFTCEEARWTGDFKLDTVQARVAPTVLALERAICPWVCTRVTASGGLLMHAAVVRSSKGALLLLARSGGGKSTASRLAGARSLCTNAAILRYEREAWQVYTTPFTGAVDPYPKHPGPFPLAGACVLEKSDVTLPPQPFGAPKMTTLARAVVSQYPNTPAFASRMLATLEKLARDCPVTRLPFRIDSILLPD